MTQQSLFSAFVAIRLCEARSFVTAMIFVFLATQLTPLIPSTGPGIWDNNT